MDIEFDPAKDEANKAKHGLSLSDFSGFDEAPVVIEDDRFDYGETRFLAFGRINGKGHCLYYTMRGSVMRMIGFRRAHEKEMKRYEQG